MLDRGQQQDWFSQLGDPIEGMVAVAALWMGARPSVDRKKPLFDRTCSRTATW
jgi:hypothetical protein